VKIGAVILENVRSHAKTIIEFSDGFSCLVGGLGRGKSSILLAIDFALFGDPLGRSYDYLLREGADIGRVALRFIENKRDYTLWRALRRRDGHISQDMEQLKLFEGERLMAEMKSEAVAEQLKAITGIDRDLFREVVWMRQEHLKELLDMPPSERQKKIDQLFGLSDYETSWTNLRPTQRWYESEKSTLEQDPDIKRIGELQAQYDESAKKFSWKTIELEDLKRNLSEAETRLKNASARVEDLEVLRRKNEELGRKERDLTSTVKSAEDVSARISKEIQRHESRIKKMEEDLESLKNQEAASKAMLQKVGLSADQTLQQIREYQDIFSRHVSSIHGERDAVAREVEGISQKISNLAAENRCPFCLQPLSSEYKEDLVTRLSQEMDDRKTKLIDLERNAMELEWTRSTLTSTISNLQTILARIEDMEKQLKDECHLLSNFSKEFEDKRREAEEARNLLKAVQREITEFEISKLEEAQRLLISSHSEYAKIKGDLQTVETQMKEISSRMDSVKERLESAERKVDRMLKVNRILEIAREIRGAYRSIQPKIRSELVAYLERIVQHELDELTGPENAPLSIKIYEDYSPFIVSPDGQERSASNLSGGERTFLAFAYRLAIGQLIMQSKLGHGLSMLLLDEPTESLGREDGSIERLAEAISRLTTIEQVIAVTHSEAFAEKAEHVTRLEKEDNTSNAVVER